jgi:hypothetical protein
MECEFNDAIFVECFIIYPVFTETCLLRSIFRVSYVYDATFFEVTIEGTTFERCVVWSVILYKSCTVYCRVTKTPFVDATIDGAGAVCICKADKTVKCDGMH